MTANIIHHKQSILGSELKELLKEERFQFVGGTRFYKIEPAISGYVKLQTDIIEDTRLYEIDIEESEDWDWPINTWCVILIK